ncbi:MAG: gamma-glutamylcyclotransferase, partial [Hyphomicrobiales bacterium]|nr:gamma-glutamylcyclotransferase [Hyphomicrobiales bacterium]
ERVRRATLLGRGGATVDALTYVVDRSHGQYAGLLSREDQLALVRRGQGQSGANREYVLMTTAHLEEMGIHDARLAWIAAELILDEERCTDSGG